MLQAGSPKRPAVARTDPAFPWFIGASLVTALAGGFALAVLLPLAVVLDWNWGLRWRALAQAHGHLQVAGWVGLFVAGMAFRLAPRFAGRPLRLARATIPALVLLAAGLAGRVIAQPWLDVPGMRAVLIAAGIAEAAGSLLVFAALVVTLAPAARTLPAAMLLMLGATGMVEQAILGGVFLTRLTASAPSIPPDRDSALLSLQFYAFLLPFTLGVSFRALPTLFAWPAPGWRWAWLVAGLLAAGAELHALARLVLGGAAGVRVEQIGALLIAAAITAAIARTGVWRTPERLRASARHPALLIRTAYAWLAVEAVALIVVAVGALRSGRPVAPYEADALRHILGLGYFTTLVMGMAQLMLPWLALRRYQPASLRREAIILLLLLTVATTLRVVGALLEGQGVGVPRFTVMAVAGVTAVVAVLLFAISVIRGARGPRPEIPIRERTVS